MSDETTTPGQALFAELENQFQPLFERYGGVAETAGEVIADALYDLGQAEAMASLAKSLIEEIQSMDEDHSLYDVQSSQRLAELAKAADEW